MTDKHSANLEGVMLDSIEKPIERVVHWIDVLPKEWRNSDGVVSVRQSVYQCLFFSPQQHGQEYISGRIGDVFYMIIELTKGLEYPVFDMEWSSSAAGASISANVRAAVTPPGVHLFIFTPYDGSNLPETAAIERISAALGLITAIEGRNAAFRHRFDQIQTFPSGPSNGASVAELSPATFPQPFVDVERLPAISEQLSKCPSEVRDRVNLALRWFHQAEKETDALDSFLKAWFALEILIMPNTDIRPVVEVLAGLYGMTYSEAQDTFQVGRIYGLRSRIVHKGESPMIDPDLQAYLNAIFVDVLFVVISYAPEYRSKEKLHAEFDKWF